jgi:Domain of Unknown Function (DUF1259)
MPYGVVDVSVDGKQEEKLGGTALPPAMGFDAKLTFQPLGGGRAAVTGELSLLMREVKPVTDTLRAARMPPTALHNHWLNEAPRLFYVHFFATGEQHALAWGLRRARPYAGRRLSRPARPQRSAPRSSARRGSRAPRG